MTEPEVKELDDSKSSTIEVQSFARSANDIELQSFVKSSNDLELESYAKPASTNRDVESVSVAATVPVPRLKSLKNIRTASSFNSFNVGPKSGRATKRGALTARQSSVAALAVEHATSGFLSPKQLQEFVSENGADMLRVRRQQYLQETLWTFAHRPSFGVPRFIGIGIGLLVPAVVACVYIGLGVDMSMELYSGRQFTARDLVWAALFPDLEQGRQVVRNTTLTASVIFGLLITVIIFVLQLASTRLTSHVSNLFFRDPVIGAELGSVVLAMIFSFWVQLNLGSYYIARCSVWLSALLVTAELMALFPFIMYLFWFLEPDKVVSKIMDNGLKAAEDSVISPGQFTEQHQVRVNMTVEHLMDAATSALARQDKDITAMIVNALLQFSILYGKYKEPLSSQPAWFTIPKWIRQSPDFLTISDEQLADLERSRAWVEWKILQNFKTLFNDSFKHMKETCYQIAINTQIIGDIAARRGDMETVELTIRFFNTYLRAGINKSDVKTVYNCLYQYRMLAEALVEEGCRVRERMAGTDLASDFEFILNDAERRAVRIMKFLRYYGDSAADRSGSNKAFVFIVETVAQDMRMICEKALAEQSAAHDQLLDVFLTLYNGTENGGKAFKGVRKAQIILTTTYLAAELNHYADRVVEELKEEPYDVLWSLVTELSNDTQKEFWEVSERGTNIHYMEPEQRAHIATFLGMFPGILNQSEAIAQRSEEKRNKKQQQLNNFD